MAGARKAKFRVGQVVFSKRDDAYLRIGLIVHYRSEDFKGEWDTYYRLGRPSEMKKSLHFGEIERYESELREQTAKEKG